MFSPFTEQMNAPLVLRNTSVLCLSLNIWTPVGATNQISRKGSMCQYVLSRKSSVMVCASYDYHSVRRYRLGATDTSRDKKREKTLSGQKVKLTIRFPFRLIH